MNKAISNKVAMRSHTVASVAIRDIQNKVPTLGEMIAACDLTTERHPDALAFEKVPAAGDERL